MWMVPPIHLFISCLDDDCALRVWLVWNICCGWNSFFFLTKWILCMIPAQCTRLLDLVRQGSFPAWAFFLWVEISLHTPVPPFLIFLLGQNSPQWLSMLRQLWPSVSWCRAPNDIQFAHPLCTRTEIHPLQICPVHGVDPLYLAWGQIEEVGTVFQCSLLWL